MINILIADDHQLIIEGIKITLNEVADINIVAEAPNGYKVIEKLESGVPVDIILMDINMPLLDGLNCTRMVTRKFPEVKVIALSMYGEKRFVKQMIRNGASGYLLKDSSKDILVKAIRTVYEGNSYFCDSLSPRQINLELKMEDTKSLFPKLSGREIEILNLIGLELSNLQIAEKLGISPNTVENHRVNIMSKAGVKNTAGLIRWAVENDILD